MAKGNERRNPLDDLPRRPGTIPDPSFQQPVSSEGIPPVQPQNKKKEGNATEKITLYLTVQQNNRIEDLRTAYRRRKGKKITANALIRKLIDIAQIEDIL